MPALRLLAAAALLLAAAPAERTGTIDTGGVALAYAERGAGPAIVLVHGSIADLRAWAPQMNALAARHRVIAYSRRRHATNPKISPQADTSLAAQADDLSALIAQLRTGPVHLVGHSFGGTVALAFTRAHPELVRSLVLAEPGVSGVASSPADEAERAAVRAERARADATGDPDVIVRTLAERVAPGALDRATPAFRAMLRENVPGFRSDQAAARPKVGCADLGALRTPTLVVTGDRSAPGLRHEAEAVAHCVPGARLIRLRDATHWMASDQPAAFNAAVLGFIAAH